MEELLSTLMDKGIRLIIAAVLLLISFKIINACRKKLGAKLEKNDKLDKTLSRTLNSVGAIVLKVLVVVSLVGYLGIETSGISAVIASLGVCVGLAVNGTLSNLAGGVMLLITRPFSLGDYIEAQSTEGTVESIGICYTVIKTVDNKRVHLPNSALSTGTIVNYSCEAIRRVGFEFSAGGNDPEKVKAALLSIAEANPLVLRDPAPFCRVTEFGCGNGTKIALRAWCRNADFWTLYSDLLEQAQKVFAAEGITVPYQQLDVHIKN